MSFIDQSKFFVKAGDGGDGCVSFRREKYVPKGGPDGGDGGRGGNVIIKASRHLHSLVDFKYRSHFKGERGTHGKGSDMHGARGKSFTLEVPVGSIIKDAETGELLADFTEAGQEFIAAKGGRGGLGNPHFASATNRTPRTATKGKTGDERWLRIELKLIADVGLVGLPNAGKSSLLAMLSAANPKISDYPFTTLEPQLGVLQFKYHPPYIIADIPGLIAGAHEGVGLGHQFLKHIERTSVILHVVDISSDAYLDNFHVIETELRKYKQNLLDRIKIVVLNKTDLVDPEMVAEIADEFSLLGNETVPVSSLTGDGIDRLKQVLVTMLATIDNQDTSREDSANDD